MAYKPPHSLFEPINIPAKILLGPGPSNSSQRVLHSMAQPIMGHLHPETLKIMDDIKDGLRYVFQTENAVTLCISASGHGGMEAALCNLIENGDVILIAINGIWGERASDMARRYGADVRNLKSDQLNCGLTLQQIEHGLQAHRPKVLFLTQGESSTGILQPLEGVGTLCRKYNCLLVVDTVASLGGTPFFADKWQIDVAYTGSQKVLGAAPGITPITFNDRAMKIVLERKTPITVYYWDINLLGDYWNCFGRPRIYHHTISATLLYGLREALAIVCQEELDTIIERHQKSSRRLKEGLTKMGLKLFVSDPKYQLPTVTSIEVPDVIQWKLVSEYAMKHFSVEISGGLGPTAGKIFRIGLMGENATFDRVDLALKVLKGALNATVNCTTCKKAKL